VKILQDLKAGNKWIIVEKDYSCLTKLFPVRPPFSGTKSRLFELSRRPITSYYNLMKTAPRERKDTEKEREVELREC
jgi:hypothetical protein